MNRNNPKWKPYIPAQLGKSSQGWYVYFSYWNPTTEKYERQPQIKKGLNRIKSLEERKKVALDMIRSLNELLEAGHLNPFISYDDTINNVPPSDQLGNMPFTTAIEWAYNKKENLAAGTMLQYCMMKKIIIESINKTLSNKPIKEIKRAQIKSVLEHIRKYRVMGNTRHSSFRTFIQSIFSELVQWDVIEFSPANRIKMPPREQQKRFEPLTDHEKILTAAHLKKVHFPLYVISRMIFTGMIRPDEILSIMEGDLKGNTLNLNPRLQNRKHKNRAIPVNDETVLAFQKLPQPEPGEYYFSTKLRPGTKKINSNTTSYLWRRLIMSDTTGIGIKKRMYALKHTSVDTFIRKGGTIEEVGLIAGQSFASTSRIYDTLGAEQETVYDKLRKTDPEY